MLLLDQYNHNFLLHQLLLVMVIIFCWSLRYLQVYPGQQVGGAEADMMAANELNAHSFLQVN